MTESSQRPSALPAALRTLAALLWSVSFGAVHDFVWADLRTGMIRLRGLPRVTQALILLGFAMLFAMLGALIFNDVLRADFPLLAMVTFTPGRGTLMPFVLMPVTMLVFAVAWAFALTGALHAHPLIRIALTLFYVVVNSTWVIASALSSDLTNIIGWAALLAAPLFVALRWRARPRPVAEFCAMLALVTLALAPAQLRQVESWRRSDIPIVFENLSGNVRFLSGVIVPLLLLVGLDMANFARQAAKWTATIVDERFPRWLTPVLLLLVLALRLRDVLGELNERVAGSTLNAQLFEYAGALGMVLSVIGVWWLLGRPHRAHIDEEAIAEAAERLALPLVIAYEGALLAFTLFLLMGVALLAVGMDAGWFDLASSQAEQVYAWATDQTGLWQLLVIIGALLAAVLFTRRARSAIAQPSAAQPPPDALSQDGVPAGGRSAAGPSGATSVASPAPALFLATFGMMSLWSWLAQPGKPLGILSWGGLGNPVDFWWVVFFLSCAVVWFVRRTLNVERTGRLLFLLLISLLVRQTDFISNPFSPFFSFAGVGFVAFGIAWDVLTGAEWVNNDSPVMSHVGRIFVYLGYTLLSVTLINWALTTHDLPEMSRLGGDVAVRGLTVFGKPMLYAIYMIVLFMPTERHAQYGLADLDAAGPAAAEA